MFFAVERIRFIRSVMTFLVLSRTCIERRGNPEIVLVFRVRIRKYDRGRCWLVVASCRSYTIDLSTEQRSSHSYEMVQVYLPISAHFLVAAASDPDLRELQCTGPC